MGTDELAFTQEEIQGLLWRVRQYLKAPPEGHEACAPLHLEWSLKELMRHRPGVARISVGAFDIIKIGDDWVQYWQTAQKQPTAIQGLWVRILPITVMRHYVDRGDSIGDPHMAVVTIVSQCTDATYDDIVACGMIDLRSSGALLIHAPDADRKFQTTLNGRALCPFPTNLSFDLMDHVMYADADRMYINRTAAQRLGCSAYEIAQVINGRAIAFTADEQINTITLGAGYLLLKSLGGVAITIDDTELGTCPYPGRGGAVILAANRTIAKKIRTLLLLGVTARR